MMLNCKSLSNTVLLFNSTLFKLICNVRGKFCNQRCLKWIMIKTHEIWMMEIEEVNRWLLLYIVRSKIVIVGDMGNLTKYWIKFRSCRINLIMTALINCYCHGKCITKDLILTSGTLKKLSLNLRMWLQEIIVLHRTKELKNCEGF